MQVGLSDADAAHPLAAPNIDLRDVQVLIVDDNHTNRRILEELVRSWGMVPTLADGAAAAHARVSEAHAAGAPFRLLLLDVCMPEVDGFTLVAQLRRRPDFDSAAILMLTSDARAEGATRCRELGVSVYLIKPVTQRALWQAVVGALAAAPAPVVDTPVVTVTPAAAGRRILLAEDNLVNQRVATYVLERLGHTVVLAENGIKAVAEHARGRFDLILMDVQMPEMNGYDATGLIRDRERQTGERTPIVAMTANAMSGDRERCLEAGMDDYVSKPVNAAMLAEKIARLTAMTTKPVPAPAVR
jgi:CheY-like chemotaxis protein